MTSYAQTNIQLFNQLVRNAYAETEIGCVRDAYVLAMRLFSGLYRSSGKTFVAHVTGTASVLAETRAPVPLVTAALLHAAYSQGEFGMLRRKITPRKRDRLRAIIGEDAEDLVAAYTELIWNDATVRAFCEGGCRSPRERHVVLIRLANEVDEYADLGALYTSAWEKRVAGARTFLPLCAELADRLAEPALAQALRVVAHETLAANRPLQLSMTSGASVLLPPLSHAPRPYLLLRNRAARIRAALRRRFASGTR